MDIKVEKDEKKIQDKRNSRERMNNYETEEMKNYPG